MSRRSISRAVLNWKLLAAFLLLGGFVFKAHKTTLDSEGQTSTEQVAVESRMRIYLTGYSYWDNTPPQSAIIARPILHAEAGGVGTYMDPVTIAVGHRFENDDFIPDYVPGTRFYVPRLRKYAMVEDLCGDGKTPQLGPCHIGFQGHPWLDLYIGGTLHNAVEAEACARRITGLQPVMMNPHPNYPTVPGEVLATKCEVDAVTAQ